MVSPKPRPEAAERSVALDGLRGYAAATVIIYHSILGPSPRLIPEVLHRGVQAQDSVYGVLLKVALSVLNGEIAVAIFFVISGIVLFRAVRALYTRTRSPGLTCAAFLLRRFLRIWPVMAVYLVLHWALFAELTTIWPGLVDSPNLSALGSNLLLMGFTVNGATWTLFWELAAAPGILLCMFAVVRFGPWAVVVPCVYMLAGLVRNHALLFHSGAMAATIPYLVAGMAIECGWLSRLTRSRRRRLLGLVALGVLAASMLFIPGEGRGYKWHLLGLWLSIPVLVGLVHTARGGLVASVLQARPSQFLGRISFSLYLWNVPVFQLLFALMDPSLPREHPLEMGLLVGSTAVLLTLPVADWSERWLEQPCIRLGRTLSRPRPPLLPEPQARSLG